MRIFLHKFICPKVMKQLKVQFFTFTPVFFLESHRFLKGYSGIYLYTKKGVL